MTDLADIFLRLPSVPLADLDRHGVTFRAALKCGGIRAGKAGNWIVGAFTDPPSCWNWVDEVVLEDLLVFDPARPDRFRTVCGSGVAMLGESHFDRTRFRPLSDGKSTSHLRVFRDPLSWVQSGGAGVCPLDVAAFARSMIGTSIRLIAEDLAHAEQIDRAIRGAVRLTLPDIRVAA